jgi:ribose transport system permease protein
VKEHLISATLKFGLRQSRRFTKLMPDRGLIVALLVLAVVFAVLEASLAHPFGYSDLSSTASGTASLALAAIGETIAILSGGLDLSAGAVLSLTNCVFVTHVGTSQPSIVLWSALAIVAGVASAQPVVSSSRIFAYSHWSSRLATRSLVPEQ